MDADVQPPDNGGEREARIPVAVYFDDLDSFGMLHNSQYTVLAERAWAAYWQQRGVAVAEDWSLLQDGFHVVKEMRISYERPVERPGPYSVGLWVEHLGRTALTYGFRVSSADGGQTYARGSRTVVHLDRSTGRPSEWSDEARALCQGLIREKG